MELKNYEENQRAAEMNRPSGLGELDGIQMGIIPVLICFYTQQFILYFNLFHMVLYNIFVN